MTLPRCVMYSGMLDEQLLTLTKLSRQTLSFYRSPETRESIAISALAEAALRVHQRKISAKRIILRKRLKADVSAEVHAGEMLQVLSNLVANAIDALPENGILCVRVRRTATKRMSPLPTTDLASRPPSCPGSSTPSSPPKRSTAPASASPSPNPSLRSITAASEAVPLPAPPAMAPPFVSPFLFRQSELNPTNSCGYVRY